MNFNAFRFTLFTLALFSAAATFGGCNFFGSFGDPPQGTGPEGADDCRSDNDCRSGELCIAEECVPGCEDDGDCSGALGVCDRRLRICQECVSDDDCAENEGCAFGSCDPLCSNDAECGSGFFCDNNLEVCAPIECLDDDNCEAGSCVNNRCEGNQCAPVGTRCEGDVLVRCNGQTESRQDCLQGCRSQGNIARCGESCEVGTQICRNGTQLLVCESGDSGAVERVENCGDDETCVVDDCRPNGCEPQCGNQECGADPVCGVSCGQCAPGESCNQNQCTGDVQPPTGALVFELRWNSIDGDLDIHLIRNNAEPCDADDDCHWRNCREGLEWDGLPTSLGDPFLTLNDDQGFGPETIEIDLPRNGQYIVGAHVYEAPQDDAVTATLRVFQNGSEIGSATQVIQNELEFWEAFDIRVSGQGQNIELEVNGRVLQQQCL